MGLDTGTYTGLAVLSRDGYSATRLLNFSKETGCKRLRLLARGVQSFVEETQPDYLFIEGYGYKNKFTLVCLVEIGTVIRMALHDMGRTWETVPPTQLKKWVTGKGTADKKLMAVSVQEKWGFTSPSDDVVDGFALAQYGLARLHDGLIPPTKKGKTK